MKEKRLSFHTGQEKHLGYDTPSQSAIEQVLGLLVGHEVCVGTEQQV